MFNFGISSVWIPGGYRWCVRFTDGTGVVLAFGHIVKRLDRIGPQPRG